MYVNLICINAVLLFWQCLICFFQVHVLVVSAAIQHAVRRGKKIQWHGGICLIRYRAEKNYMWHQEQELQQLRETERLNVQLNASVYDWSHTVKYCNGSSDVFLQICPWRGSRLPSSVSHVHTLTHTLTNALSMLHWKSLALIQPDQ